MKVFGVLWQWRLYSDSHSHVDFLFILAVLPCWTSSFPKASQSSKCLVPILSVSLSGEATRRCRFTPEPVTNPHHVAAFSQRLTQSACLAVDVGWLSRAEQGLAGPSRASQGRAGPGRAGRGGRAQSEGAVLWIEMMSCCSSTKYCFWRRCLKGPASVSACILWANRACWVVTVEAKECAGHVRHPPPPHPTHSSQQHNTLEVCQEKGNS